MRYGIRHVTRFTYDAPVTESVMEIRMQPRSDGAQRCLHFALTPDPAARVLMYQDHDGNTVHHFNIPARHSSLTVTAEAVVECDAARPLPHRLGPRAWQQLDALTSTGEFWELLWPGVFTSATPLLDELARDISLERGNDPLVMLRRLMGEIYARFEYSPQATRVDSPIEEPLQARRGVCQDFAHIFLALVRRLGVPARYVSGYLFRGEDSADRSADGATHAWVEVLLPTLGWIGLDPTNNLLAEDRHVRVAVGRDYADVPPTRGVYQGASTVRSELAVAVSVDPVASSLSGGVVPFTPWLSRDALSAPHSEDEDAAAAQQQ